jgi:hypothetical protein
MHLKNPHLLIAIVIFVVEVLIATIFANIKFVRHLLGDFLVVMLIYHFIKSFYKISPLILVISVFLFACGVEMLQYLQFSDLLGLRRGGIPSILIGTSFSWLDILMYFLGCITSFCVDTCFLDKASYRFVHGE